MRLAPTHRVAMIFGTGSNLMNHSIYVHAPGVTAVAIMEDVLQKIAAAKMADDSGYWRCPHLGGEMLVNTTECDLVTMDVIVIADDMEQRANLAVFEHEIGGRAQAIADSKPAIVRPGVNLSGQAFRRQ